MSKPTLLRRFAWWVHDIPAAVTYRARFKRMTHSEIVELAYQVVENFSHLEGIRTELGKIRDELEHLVIMTGGPRR